MNQIVPLKTRQIADYTPAQLDLMRRTVAKDCEPAEFDLFLEMAKRAGLDPFRRQIYAIVTNKKKKDRRQLAVVTGIDGYRSIADRSALYRPADAEPEFEYDEGLIDADRNPLGIVKCVVRIWKKDAAQSQWYAVIGVAYWDEFAPIEEIGRWEGPEDERKFVGSGKYRISPAKQNWRKMPRVMLAKCAEAQALRKGWPESLSGLYVEEEMHRAMVDITASEAADLGAQEDRLKRIGAVNCVPMIMDLGAALEMIPLGKFGDRCAAFVRAHDPETVRAWNESNREGLRQFWAMAPTDALELKKIIEARVAAAPKPAPTANDQEKTNMARSPDGAPIVERYPNMSDEQYAAEWAKRLAACETTPALSAFLGANGETLAALEGTELHGEIKSVIAARTTALNIAGK